MENHARKRARFRGLQTMFEGSFAPDVRNRVLRAQSEIRRQHFIGLPRHGLADTIGQEPDRGQCADGQRHGRKQDKHLTRAQLAAEAA